MARLSQAQRNARLAEVRESVFEITKDYETLFSSPVGDSVLADLEKQFGGSVIERGDPYMTHANAGAQEVLLYIKLMIRGQPNVDEET